MVKCCCCRDGALLEHGGGGVCCSVISVTSLSTLALDLNVPLTLKVWKNLSKKKKFAISLNVCDVTAVEVDGADEL